MATQDLGIQRQTWQWQLSCLLAIVLIIGTAACKMSMRDTPSGTSSGPEPQPSRAALEAPADSPRALRAFSKALGSAAHGEESRLRTLLAPDAPHLDSPLPVVPIDSMGERRPVSSDVDPAYGWRIEEGPVHEWRVRTLVDDTTVSSRLFDFSVKSDPVKRPAIVFNLYESLPEEAHLLNGVAWALTELPEVTQAGPGCLRDQLRLIVPEQTISAIESALGKVSVFASAQGIRLDFTYQNKGYHLLAIQEDFGGRLGRYTILVDEHKLTNGNSLEAKFGVADAGRWTKIQGGLAGL